MAFALVPWLLSGFDSMDFWTGDLSSLWLFAQGCPQLFALWDSAQGSTKHDSRPASEHAEVRTREQQQGGAQSLSDASAGSMSRHFLHIRLLEVGHQFSPLSREDFAQKHGYQETGSLRGHLRAGYRKKDLISSDHPSLESFQKLNNSFEAECHNTSSQISLIMCALCYKKQQKLIILSHIYNRNTFLLMNYLTGVLISLRIVHIHGPGGTGIQIVLLTVSLPQ